MDKKVAKTSGEVSKKKGASGVSRAAYGVVASATGSGGAPTSFKSSNKSRRQAKLKTQERVIAKDVDEAAAVVATLTDLKTKVDLKALLKSKEKSDIKKKEYEEGQQQQITNTPTEEIALSIPPGETATVDSIDVDDDEEEDSPPLKAILLDNSPATVRKKRKRQTLSQKAAAEIKAKALKQLRKPPSTESTVHYSTGRLEDSFPKEIGSKEKDLFKDIAANIVSKEKVEKQLEDYSKKLQELSSESEGFKQKKVELLTELGELREAAETSAAAKRDLEKKIEMSKTELEQTKLELQRIRSEAATEKEEKNQRIREIEARNATVLSELERERSRSDRTTQAAEETNRRATEVIVNNQEEIERLRRDIKANSVAGVKEMSVLQRENESQQTRIRELESKVDTETASVAEKVSRLEAAEAKTEHLEKQMAELHLAKEKELKLLDEQAKDLLASSERKMKELQAQLKQQKEKEAQFMREVEANNEELRERFKQEKKILEEELKKTAESRLVAIQLAEEARKESEKIKASIENANRLFKEAEERRIIAEKKEMEKTNEFQEFQRKIKEENERLHREKLNLIKRVEDAERQQERLEKQKQEAMAVEQYETAATAISESSSYQNIVSEVSDAMSVIQKEVISQNHMFAENVTENINDLRKEISLSGQELANRQDTRLAEGIRRFGELIKNSMNKDEEIQDTISDMIRKIDEKMVENQVSISTAMNVVKRLEDRIVDGMNHDDSSDTNKIKLAWNLIKKSLINMISTAYTEINNLRKAVKKSTAIRDKGYVESAKRAAERTFSLLVYNTDLDNILMQLDIRVSFFSGSTRIERFRAPDIDSELLVVEVENVGNDLEDDVKAIKSSMSMASATYREIETILSGVRVIAVQFANTERQSLVEIETSKIVANLEDSTASRLYYELDRFYLFASTIENVSTFQDVMRTNTPLFKVFKDAIPFMGSRKDNRGIMEFLKKKGYSIGEDMATSIDDFFSKIMGVKLTEVSEREQRMMDENVFISTIIGILAIVSEAIQQISNKIEENRKQEEVRTNQMESRRYLEEQLEDQRNIIAVQMQPTGMSIAAEIREGRDSEEKYSQDIDILIDSAVRETKTAYEDTLDRLKKQYEENVEIIQAQQLEQQRQFQEQLQTQREHQQREQEYMKRFQKEIEQYMTINQQTIDMFQQQQKTTSLPPSPSSTPSRGPSTAETSKRKAELQDRDMEITKTGTPGEDEPARPAREMKKQLTNVLTRATQAAKLNNTGEKTPDDGGRSIKMFLKPEASTKNFVEITLSSKDSYPRNIDTKGLSSGLPDMSSEETKEASSLPPKKSEAALKNNTLTGKIFLDTLKDKVFPYSSKLTLEDEDKEGGSVALHHPEYFRSSFSKHFIPNSITFTEPPTFAEKSESVRNFTRLLEYSLFNDTARGTRSDNDILSKLIYVVFEHDAKVIRYLSDITYKFREYARGVGGSNSINLYKDRGNLLEAIIATVFSAALPVVSSMVPRIAEAMSKPVLDDVRIRSTYSLLSLIEKFIFCASKRVHVLKNVLEKSGLVNRLSLYPTDANTDRVTSFDVQYDYSLLRMLLELMTINITNLVDAGIRPLKAVVLSIGTFTGADKTKETDRAFIPIDKDKSVLSKVSGNNDIDVPKTISVVNYLSAVTDWYVANRFSENDADKESLNKAVNLMHTLLTDNLGDTDNLAVEFNNKLTNATPSTIVEYVSKTALPKLNTMIEEIVKKTKSNDAILVKGASAVGSLGETAMNVSLGVSRDHLALPWLEVDFRGGVDDSTLLWVLSGGVNSDEVVREYQLAVPLYSYSFVRKRSGEPLHIKPLVRTINNTSGSDNVFLTTNNNKKTPGKEERDDDNRAHVVHLTKNVSCVLEYSNKDRYEAIINKMYRDGLVLVKGDAEVPRVFPTLDGKWMDNSRDNRTFTLLSVNRWKMPSASLVYGMLSKKKTKEEMQNQDREKKNNKTNTSAPSVIDFMGGRAGNVLLKMLTLPSEQPIVATTNSSFDAPSTNKGLWKTNKDGYTSIDAQSMMDRLISDNKRPIKNTASSLSSMAMVPYSDAASVVVNDPLELYNSNNSWWIRGIPPNMRKDAAALSAIQEHLYFVQTPIF